MDRGEVSLLEDFGQRVDLTRRIREVLANYPEGTTVLKELIQNADDAGASKVCFCLDRRTHGSRSLLSPELAQWQGPALLAYNDAVFTEDDFVSISRIGDSKKQSQPWKTGRFGVGFNSVYHLTDLPSFVSDKYVVLFDPQGAYLPNVSSANPGKRLDYVSTPALSMYEDQFSPYCAFGCDMKNPFPGTLFRFPLRDADKAALSRLSRQAYSKDDINSMFMQLYRESVFTLLFLKSIISLEMYVWDDGSNEPQKLYSCSIISPNENTAWHRQAILRFSNFSGTSIFDVGNFFLEFASESLVLNIEKRIDKFFIVQKMASSSTRITAFASTAAKDYDLHLLPWASVAACVSDDSNEASFLRQGQAFCSLPLPVSTGLPVQVNGFFEVSSNRRSIWYGADMDRAGKLRSDWNILLLEDVVAPSFNELLLGLRELCGPCDKYYSLWPTGTFEEPWNILVKYIYKIICLSPVFYSDVGGGRWMSLSEAFIHDREFSKSEVLAEALVLLGMPIVHLPHSLIQMLKVYYTDFHSRVVNPSTVRHFLKNCKTLDGISRSYRLVVLDYCLSDLDDADVGKIVSGLPLIPLENGQFGIFSEASKGISFFVCNELEYELFKVASDRIVDRCVPSELFNRLVKIAGASSTNILFINDQVFLQFFPRFFPVAWKDKNSVFWDPESMTSPPTPAWLKLFWQYLCDQSYSLSLFHEWPILPTVSGYMYRASKSSKLIKAELLSYSMNELLRKLGCKILAPNYGVEHKELSLYVYDGNAAGVLNSIFEVFSSNEEQLHLSFQDFSIDERFELCRFLLDPKWYLGASLSDLDIKKCKKLPIFRLHSHGDSNVFKFSDLESSRKYLPPVGISEHLLGDEFIYCMTKKDEDILVRYFGIQHMKKVTFYKQNVLSVVDTLQTDIRDSVMLAILHDFPPLCSEDSSFRESLKMTRFVPTVSGSLKSPPSLYDPRIEHFGLLEESDCFPSGVYQETGILDMLLLLGLQTSISVDTIVQSARQIESLVHKDQVKAHIRGKVLFSYLEVNAVKWLYSAPNYASKLNAVFSKINIARRGDGPSEANLEKFWNDLRMICWCPVLVTSPHPGLPWPSVSSKVAPPKMVRLQGDMWLVSASTCILDGECSSTLSFCLGWSTPPGGSVIAAQLLELGKNNEVVTDQSFRQELALAMPKMYSLLTNLIGSDEMDIVKAVLEGCRWIWVGDGFATADEVVLSGHLHLAPYMRVIPVDLAVFRELFLELGIKEFLKPLDYANILFRIAARKDRNPLDGQELRVALLVVQYLAEVQFQDLQVQIYLPDVSCRLFPSTDLVYNDAPWLLDSEESTSRDTSNVSFISKRDAHNFVHGNISNDLAEKLGVRSLRRLLLAESSDSMNLSLSGVAEVFGQHEALTTRLKHIVEMYADGPGILFELVQNAEDAHASEVIFLLDKTQYGTSSILSPEMAEWQGPALYCFNDSIFTSQDLYAISRVGQDSKLDKPFAIGRFGLGFNCVYHFTDIPCFVSGENLVIFDPHASYLPGISPSHPGLKIRFVGRKILEQFPDQFTPFLHFGCDLQKSFPGTLFRFPLRTEYAASRSQIKKEKYAPDDVESLFSSFCEVASETLLFLRFVKKISLFVKHETGQEMQLIHSVSRNSVNGLVKEPHPFYSMLNFIHGSKQSGMDMNQFTNKLSKIEDKDLPWSCQKVAIVEESVAGNATHLWFVSESIGGGHVRKKFIEIDNKSHKLIPWASVAAYLTTVKSNDLNDSNDFLSEHLPGEIIENKRNMDGKAFCFLPLPIVTGLPVHVNAYFELSSNRRDIWFGNDMSGGGKVRSEWNMCLLEDAIAPAFVRLLAFIAQDTGPSNLFFSFWPTVMGVEPWASMIRKFYQSIVHLGLPILFTKARGGQWISTKQAIFPDHGYTNAEKLAEALAEAGLPMASVSKQIVDRFIEACPSLHFLNPQLLRTLLIRRKREFKNKDAVIMTLDYCLSDMSLPAFYGKLHGLPLIPLANGSLTAITKHGEGERIFITSEMEFDLLKEFVPQLLVDCSIPDGVARKLYELANSGELNIQILTCSSLVELFPRILPPEWQYMKEVSWNPSITGHPNMEWMRLLWKYIRTSCTDLTLFAKWPILPVGNSTLLQVFECSNVIRDEGWTENMHSLLQKLGCFFLRSDIAIDHPQLKKIVQDATMYGVLNAISANASLQTVNILFDNISMGEKHEFRNYILQSKWYTHNDLNAKHIDIIKMLPIFECYKSRELANLSNPIKWLKPEGTNEDLLDANFIRTESVKERNILKGYLGINEQSKSEFYKNHVLSRMSEFLVQPSLLSAILSNVNLLVNEDPTMKSAFSEIPFVLAANGTWKHPSRLYDPRIPGLQNLLHKDVFFPSERFLKDEVLDSLVMLGLKRTLGFSALVDCARSASILHGLSNIDAVQHGRRLLMCLNIIGLKLSDSEGKAREDEFGRSILSNHDKSYTEESQEESTTDTSCLLNPDVLDLISNFYHDKSEEEFWSEMKNIAWCPVIITPSMQGLPWFIAGNCMASPTMTRPKSQMWIVSSSMHILDGDCYSTYVQEKLGWMDPPDIKVLCSQLVELSRSYDELKRQNREHAVDELLGRNIPLIYSYLQESIGSEEFKTLKEYLDGVPWVYIGDSFVSPKALAFDSPVKYGSYLYAVPSELSLFRALLSELGVRATFTATDYLHVLQRLKSDMKDEPLSDEQLSFVHRVLEAFADCYSEKKVPVAVLNILMIPDSFGVMMCASDLVYNDAPWMTNISSNTKHFVHPSISDDMARKLGVKSLGSLSLVDEQMTRDLPCMDYARICDLLALYGDNEFILFDLLELADKCNTRKVEFIYDKRQHPRQSLLQQNLGEFQGSSLTIILEGATLSVEEVCRLQLPPPWKIQGSSLQYGSGLISSYFICDLLTILSAGYFYIFDPLGLALPAPSGGGPAARLFSLKDTDLIERFRDQFSPFLTEDGLLPSSNSMVIRIPLSSKLKKQEENDCKRVTEIFHRFMQHASSKLLFLKSILQVSLSTWEDGSSHQSLNYSVSIDPKFASMRNPFSEKKWRKFQISRLFSSSGATTKVHVVDIQVIQEGSISIDKWVIVLCLGSGQTRNMALDRRYLSYSLTPVAGVAAQISQNGFPVTTQTSSSVLSPLPLSGSINMPVTALGCFLVSHNGGRYLFNHALEANLTDQQFDSMNHLIEAWNRELLLCVRDAYIELAVEFHKLKKDPLSSAVEPNLARAVGSILQAYGDRIYSFWPRSKQHSKEIDLSVHGSNVKKDTGADWQSLVEHVIRPFYVSLVDLPVWQLYGGNTVKADEGMFLSQSGTDQNNLPPPSVCSFIKEHYPVFSVPCELVREIQAVGIKVREIKPKMVRDLLKNSSSVVLRSIETYIDVLEYCLSDVQLHQLSNLDRADGSGKGNIMQTGSLASSSRRHHQDVSGTSGGDALEIMTYFGKALYDFSRGVVEDISRTGIPSTHRSSTGFGHQFGQPMPSIVTELGGLPFPLATNSLTRIGITELWIGDKEQQLLMHALADNFVHSQCLEKPVLSAFLHDETVHRFFKLRKFSAHLLTSNLRFVFGERWVNQVMSSRLPWILWNKSTDSAHAEPNSEWIRLFWKIFSATSGEVSLIDDWPLIPALLDRPVLCRTKATHLIFVPPLTDLSIVSQSEGSGSVGSLRDIPRDEIVRLYAAAYESAELNYPWLFSLISQFNIPLFDMSFLDCDLPCNFFPEAGQTIGKVVVSKLVAAKACGCFNFPVNLSNDDRERLFNLFASSNASVYRREELDLLRELPIYRTVLGTYTRLMGSNQCTYSPSAFFHPTDDRCLSSSTDTKPFLYALGVSELNDQDILVRFGLPEFEKKNSEEQEKILLYLYTNWTDLQLDPAIVNTLKETKFVRNANELCSDLFKPRDLFDPCDILLASIFSGERDRFPGESFITNGWLQILKKTGLRTSLQADTLIECAKKLEMLGKESVTRTEDPNDFDAEFSSNAHDVSFEIWSLADSLVQLLFANFAILYDNAFCDKLSNIAFVPAEKGFPSISGKKGGKRTLSSYKEAALLKDWPLVWTSAPILVKQNVIPPEYSWGAFHLRSPPAFSTVLKHLQVVGKDSGLDTLAHWPISPGMMTVEDTFLEILKYLDKLWGALSPSDIKELKKLAIVPVANGTRLVAAESLFVRLSINLSPFAFELPSIYLPFVKILKEIGMQDGLSVSFARDLLLSIQKSCGYQRLNPNELRAVLEVLNFICSEANQAISDEENWISSAIIPDDGCRLVLAKSCVYVDQYGSHFVNNIDTSRLRFAHPELPENILAALNINKLSDIVIEELHEESGLEFLDHIGPVQLNRIKDKLLSQSLQDALLNLIRNITYESPSFEGLSSPQIKNLMNLIAGKLQFVQRLQTRFLMLPKRLDITKAAKHSPFLTEWQGNMKHRSLHFVEKSRSRVLVAEPPNFMAIYDVIAVAISQALGLPKTLPIGPLFACPDGYEGEVVKVLRLGYDSGNINCKASNDELLGKELLPQDALQIQFLPLRPFYAGEIVAWKTGREGEKLRYGRVPEDVKPSDGQAFYRFPIEIAPGKTQNLLSSHVFSFKSVSMADFSSSLVGGNEDTVQNKLLHGQTSNNARNGKIETQNAKDLQYGKVSSREMVQAVHDMLSAAGINMDAEKQALFQTTLSLQEQLKESQIALLVEQEKADVASKEAEAAKAAWSCRVCLSAEVNISIVPCGHVLCQRCSSAVSKCPFCRTQVARTMKIFRP